MWRGSRQAQSVLVVAAAAFSGLYVLFSAAPVMVAASAGSFGAGLITTVFMALTIVAQFLTPFGLRRLPPARLLLASLLFLSVPSVVYALDVAAWVLVVAAGLRGLGFGLMTIVCTALVSAYAEPGKQGSAIGVYGLATSVTGIVAPSLGVIILDGLGSGVVATAAFALPLVGAFFLKPIQAGSPKPMAPRKADTMLADRVWTWARFAPLVIFVPVAVAYGGSYTFLPLFSALAAFGLLMLGVGFAIGRVIGGRLVDRSKSVWVITPFALVAAAGIVVLAWTPSDLFTPAACLVLGFGIGGTASASLASMMASVAPSRYGFVSTAWNLSFDLGIAIGGLGLGLLIAPLGLASGASIRAVVIVLTVLALFVPLSRLGRYHKENRRDLSCDPKV